MSSTDPAALARELIAAHELCELIVPPSARDAGFDLATGYAVEAELAQLRAAAGHKAVGRKVGFANRAVWRALKLDTLVWAHMYDDTVRFAVNEAATLSLDRMCAPKIEPEIVFRMKHPLGSDGLDAAAVLNAVDWIALGFEIIDSVFVDWKFQPADFVASFGLHAALVVGTPRPIVSSEIPALVDQLARFKVSLSKGGQPIAEGGGRNVLKSPALCVGELASAISRSGTAAPLAAGELVSSGTLTESQPIAAGERWTAALDGLDLPTLTLHT